MEPAKTRISLFVKPLPTVARLYPDKDLKPTMPLFALNFLKINIKLIFIFVDYENNDVVYFHFSGIFRGLWQRKGLQANMLNAAGMKHLFQPRFRRK